MPKAKTKVTRLPEPIRDYFLPKDVGMDRDTIWDFFYTKDGNRYYVVGANGFVKKPTYTVDEIPNKLCQRFVDEWYCILNEGFYEEERVDEVNALVEDMHRVILKALKRKERVTKE